MVQETPNATSLLEKLRGSQAVVAGEIATLTSSLAPLGDAVAAIAAALAEAQQLKAELSAEKLTALQAIQTALEVAVASIRAVSKYPGTSDPFTEPHRMGGPQTP